MAVAVDAGVTNRLKAAVAVDGGSIETTYAQGEGASNRTYGIGTMHGAVSHRLQAGVVTWKDGSDCSIGDSDCLLRLSEGGASAGYALRPSDSDTTRAGDSHGHRVMNGTYHASVGMGDRGTNDLYEMKIAAGDAPIGTIQADSGCVRAAVSHRAEGTNDLLEAGGSTFDSGCGCSDGIGTVRAVIEII